MQICRWRSWHKEGNMSHIMLINLLRITFLVSGVLFCALTEEIVFLLPKEGDIFTVGDTMRIKFDIVDSSIQWTPALMVISADGFLDYGTFPTPLNGTDTVSILKHYDWVVTAKLYNSFTNRSVSVVGPEVQLGIIPYPGGGASARGYSKAFAIQEKTEVIRPLRLVKKDRAGTTHHAITFINFGVEVPMCCERFYFNGRRFVLEESETMKLSASPSLMVISGACQHK